MSKRVSQTYWMIPLIVIVGASAAYQLTSDKKEILDTNRTNEDATEIPTNNKSVNEAVIDYEFQQDLPPTRLDVAQSMQNNVDNLTAAEPNDNSIDTHNSAIRLPSEQLYDKEFRDTLITSFKNGTMTLSQRRDFFTALNHSHIPVVDKNLSV